MNKLTNLSWGIGLIAAATLATGVQAAPPCFENDTTFDAHVWGIQGYSEKEYLVVKPGEKVCAAEDAESMVGIAFAADEPPYVGDIKVKPGGTIRVVKDTGGYHLAAFDAEGNQTMKVKLAQPRGG